MLRSQQAQWSPANGAAAAADAAAPSTHHCASAHVLPCRVHQPLLLPPAPQIRIALPAELKGLPLVALVNAGAIKNSIPAGLVTVGQLQEALPYSMDG